MTQKRNDNGQIVVNFNIFSRLRILELLVRSVQGVFGFLGTIFTLVTMTTIVCGLSLGGIFWIYGRDLPSH